MSTKARKTNAARVPVASLPPPNDGYVAVPTRATRGGFEICGSRYPELMRELSLHEQFASSSTNKRITR